MVARWTGLRIGLSIAVLLSAAACRQQPQEPAAARAKVVLATQAVPCSGLIAVADEKGYFAHAGLEVRIDLYPSGRDALGALMRGEAHVATVADIALAGAIIDDPTLRVIASIGTSTGSQVVARRDRSIATPADLKGKRVGYSPGTASHYYLHSFLLMNGIRRDDIAAVPVPPARQAQAVVSGEVDAVAAFDVYAFVAGRELAANAVAWDMQNTIDYQWLLEDVWGNGVHVTDRVVDNHIVALRKKIEPDPAAPSTLRPPG